MTENLGICPQCFGCICDCSTPQKLRVDGVAAPKFTPGPWEVENWEALINTCTLPVRQMRIVAGPRLMTVVAHPVGNDVENWESNARLIAAAPELLEACKRALSWMLACEAETGRPMGEGLGYKGRMHKPVAAEILRVAIAKATGEEP